MSTGIRVSECQGLDLDDLDFIEKRITVVRKGGKSSFIYLNDEICTLLLDYIKGERSYLMQGYPDERALFVSNRHSRMCVKAIENVVKKYTKEVTGTDKYTPHKLRSTYGTGSVSSNRRYQVSCRCVGALFFQYDCKALRCCRRNA